MKFSTVIFDLDGTLLNTLGDLTSSVNAVMSAHQFPTLSAHDVQQRVGHGMRNLIAKSVPEGTDEAVIDVCLDEMISYYSKHLNIHTRAYDGVPAAIKAIDEAGLKIAVLSNKYDAGAKELIHDFFPSRVDLTLGERPGVPRKPDPTSTFEILKRLNADPATTAFVGDSSTDMRTAKNAGLLAVGVTWGFRSREDLEEGGADIVITHPSELPPLLTGGLSDLDQLEETFTRNGFAFSYFETGEEAAAYLAQKCAGKKSTFGGSMTLNALGLYDTLKEAGEDVTWHSRGDGIRSAGDVFLTSANALSESGEIVNIDGNCNRIADAMWGFKECYVVCGYNKLAADLPSAMRRARRVAGPLNARRLNRDTPCVKTGVCCDCHSPDRICAVMAITMMPPKTFEHYEIVLIGEHLGY